MRRRNDLRHPPCMVCLARAARLDIPGAFVVGFIFWFAAFKVAGLI